jgi:hypothetical protein
MITDGKKMRRIFLNLGIWKKIQEENEDTFIPAGSA